MVELQAVVPYSRNDLVALWRERGVIEAEDYGEHGVQISGKLPIELLSQFTAFNNAHAQAPINNEQ